MLRDELILRGIDQSVMSWGDTVHYHPNPIIATSSLIL